MNIILEHATSMTCSGSSTVRASVMIVGSLHKAGHNHRQWDFRQSIPVMQWNSEVIFNNCLVLHTEKSK